MTREFHAFKNHVEIVCLKKEKLSSIKKLDIDLWHQVKIMNFFLYFLTQIGLITWYEDERASTKDKAHFVREATVQEIMNVRKKLQ